MQLFCGVMVTACMPQHRELTLCLSAAIPPGLTDARAVTTAIVGSGSHPYCSNIPNTLFDYNTRQVSGVDSQLAVTFLPLCYVPCK